MNPNAFPVTLTHIDEYGTRVTVTGGSGCTSTDAGVSVPTQSVTFTLEPGSNVVTVPNGASMSATAFTGCQTASFQIPVTVTVKT